jgi:hypothetical protein
MLIKVSFFLIIIGLTVGENVDVNMNNDVNLDQGLTTKIYGDGEVDNLVVVDLPKEDINNDRGYVEVEQGVEVVADVNVDTNMNYEKNENMNEKVDLLKKLDNEINLQTKSDVPSRKPGDPDYHCEDCKDKDVGCAELVNGKDPNDSRQWDDHEFAALDNNKNFNMGVETENLEDEEVSLYSDTDEIIEYNVEGEDYFEQLGGEEEVRETEVEVVVVSAQEVGEAEAVGVYVEVVGGEVEVGGGEVEVGGGEWV